MLGIRSCHRPNSDVAWGRPPSLGVRRVRGRGRFEEEVIADRNAGEPGRFRKLAQAALNADATVDQVNVLLTDMAIALDGFEKGLSGFNGTLTDFDGTLDSFVVTLAKVDNSVDRLDEIVTRMSDVVTRVERIVDLGERALSPVVAVESGVRRVVTGVVGFVVR